MFAPSDMNAFCDLAEMQIALGPRSQILDTKAFKDVKNSLCLRWLLICRFHQGKKKQNLEVNEKGELLYCCLIPLGIILHDM